MKGILQQFVIAAIALSLTSFLFSGLIVSGGVQGFLFTSVLLMFGFMVVRPILTILTLPLGIFSLGLFSIVTTAVVLFIISFIDKGFSIQPFLFPGLSLFVITIPSFHANTLLSYVLISVTIQVIYRMAGYVFDI